MSTLIAELLRRHFNILVKIRNLIKVSPSRLIRIAIYSQYTPRIVIQRIYQYLVNFFRATIFLSIHTTTAKTPLHPKKMAASRAASESLRPDEIAVPSQTLEDGGSRKPSRITRLSREPPSAPPSQQLPPLPQLPPRPQKRISTQVVSALENTTEEPQILANPASSFNTRQPKPASRRNYRAIYAEDEIWKEDDLLTDLENELDSDLELEANWREMLDLFPTPRSIIQAYCAPFGHLGFEDSRNRMVASAA